MGRAARRNNVLMLTLQLIFNLLGLSDSVEAPPQHSYREANSFYAPDHGVAVRTD
jgi:hypothetical protein